MQKNIISFLSDLAVTIAKNSSKLIKENKNHITKWTAFDCKQKNMEHNNPFSANPTKWSSTLKQFVGNLLLNFLSVFDHFAVLALKGLRLLW